MQFDVVVVMVGADDGVEMLMLNSCLRSVLKSQRIVDIVYKLRLFANVKRLYGLSGLNTEF